MQLNPLRILMSLCLLAIVAACNSVPAASTVPATYDRNYNFAAVKSIYIEPFSRTDPATITVSDGQIVRINAAITAELEKKGFSLVKDSASADLFLSWYLITEDRVYSAPGACPGCDRPADSDSQRYAKGTLIVDMIDPIRNQAVWRSKLHTPLTAHPDSPDAEQARRKSAAAIFVDFPPA
jgi:hypothetical protein